MSVNAGSGVAARRDADRWGTLWPERHVAMVARTTQSTVRVLEAAALFNSDSRVALTFAYDGSSRFGGLVPDLLRTAGIGYTPLKDISPTGFNLALTASESIDFARIKAPHVVIPHGIGFHRYVPSATSDGLRLSGLVSPSSAHCGDFWMTVGHPAQREQLRAEYPEAADRCVVLGDLAFDRIVASIPLRDRYRQLLGVGPGQRLVVATSTWHCGSLLETWRELPAQLVGELPREEYRVALVLHPNVRSWHEEQNVRRWLADARAAGLMLLPPSWGWQAALIAADLVIGDHGSVTLYGAAIDRPVLLAGDITRALVVPGTPPTQLAQLTATLRADLPFTDQIEAAIAGHRRDSFAALADRMFARQGEAAHALRDFLYATLRLDPPDIDVSVPAVENPEPERTAPSSFVVYTAGEGDVIRLWRFPAAARRNGAPAPDPAAVRHLCVGEDEPDRNLPANASVIVRRVTIGPAEDRAWMDRTFRQYPGCLIVAAPVAGGCVAGTSDGLRVRLTTPPGCWEFGVAALYARLRARQSLSGQLTVRAGTASFTATLAPET